MATLRSRILTLAVGVGIVSSGGAGAADYVALHNTLIKFYGYQRSGLSGGQNPYNPFYTRTPYPHASDAMGSTDLSGGWYDAGDFVKFGLPLGYAAYCLLKGYDVFPRVYDDLNTWSYKGTKDGIPDILGEAKVATDYIMKAVISDRSLVVDVGNGFQDHQQWVSGYNSTAPRTVYANAGADIAGLYAASLALMSILYRAHDAAYADRCLAKAKDAFKFGLLNQKLSEQQKDPNLGNKPYYSTTTFKDKMACGAIELYRATKEQTYLTWARTYQGEVRSHYYVLGYANCGDLSAFELYRQGQTDLISSWMTDVNMALSRVVTAANASSLIKGAFINSDWGTARDAGNAAFSAALAYMVKGDKRYKDFVFQQINWVVGYAPFTKSYVVNFNGGPRNPHHRNASTLGIPLAGGIVSGPSPSGNFDPSHPENSSWSFTDSRDVYVNTEVAIDYNAAAIGAVAFIRDYLNPPAGLIRIDQGLRATPDPLDLNTGSLTITGTFETSQSWKLVLTGRNSTAKKTVTGTGATISVQWAGDADAGSFSSGEFVDVKLDMPTIAEYHAALATTSFYLSAAKKETPKTTDILVDDFNDGDFVNKISGTWSAFNDQKSGGASYTFPATLGATAITTAGESATKALLIRLVGRTGAAHPHAGVKTSFNAAGTPVSVGNVSSVMFDVKSGSDSALLWVEIEQSDIADGAYYGAKVAPPTGTWARIRIPISAFAQPSWKTAAKPLGLAKVTSLRFTYYGTSSIQISLDNVRMENLSVGGASVRRSAPAGGSSRAGLLGLAHGEIRYRLPRDSRAPGHVELTLTNLAGTKVAGMTAGGVAAGELLGLKTGPLSPGSYLLRLTSDRHAPSTCRLVVP